jgi:hypothetical protein
MELEAVIRIWQQIKIKAQYLRGKIASQILGF